MDELLRQQQQPFLPQEQEDDLLASLGGRAMSGLQYIGQTLDKPGRAVRGLLSGDPSSLLNLLPFSDTLGITDPAKGVTGRDLLDQFGLLDKSDEGVLPFAAGLGVDIATDPLTYLSFGGGALTKAGRVAEKAGLLKGAELAGTNVGRMTHGLEDLLPQLGPTVQRAAAHTAAEAAGTSLEELANQPLQTFAKANIPFAHDSGVNLLGGPAGQYLGGKLDAVGHALRYGSIPGTNFSPGMAMANLFDKGSEGLLTETGQKIGATAFEARKTAATEGRRTAQEWVDNLIQSGHAKDSDGPMIRQVIEGVIQPPTPELAAIKASHDAEMASELAKGQAMGRQVEALDDISGTDYAHRQATGPASRAGKGSHIFNTGSPADRAREDIYKGIYGGTEQLRDIIRDPAIRDAATVDDARGVIASKYGQSFAAEHPLEQMQGLADRIRSLPQEQVDIGLFGNHPLVDAQHGLVATKEANAATATVLDNIAKHSVPADSVALGADTVDVNKILQTAKLTPLRDHAQGGALQYIADKLGITDPNEISQLGSRRMPADLAGDLVRLHQGFNVPNSVHPLLQGLDSYTNLFKAGVLTWPARFVRDFISGQWNNMVTGNFSGRTVGMAEAMVKGGVAEGASKIPYVQQMLEQSGKALTDENATEALRKLIASHGLVDKFERGTNDVAGNVLGHTSGGIDELLSARPGQNAFSMSGTLKSVIPTSLEEANPLNVRGFNGKLETQFAPVKAGADATYYIDVLNRVSPFIDQLEKGVAPEVAAAKIASSQAQYGGKAYTSFENSVMKRLAPFYSFSRSMIPFTLRTLYEHPGGLTAQAIRASLEGRQGQGFLPEYLGKTLAVPLGHEDNGTQRYLTGLGMPHEDVTGLIQPGGDITNTIGNTLQDLLGRANPALKMPFEFASGKQLFSGRELSDLDSNIGRLATNAGITDEKPNVPVWMDELLANSPLSRLASTARMLGDDRKDLATKAAGLVTPVKIADIDMAKQRSIGARDQIEELLRSSPHSKVFTHLFIPPAEAALMSPEEQRQWQVYRHLSAIAERDARARKKSGG